MGASMKLSSIKAGDIFPILDVCDDCIAVTTGGALTMGWELKLPVAYTQSEAEYDAMILNMNAAIKGLDPWTIVHRQDLYLYEDYKTPECLVELRKGFLGNAYEEHYRNTRHLAHYAYIFLTYGNRDLVDKSGKSSGLFGILGKKPLIDESSLENFLAKSDKFISILTNGVDIKARRLNKVDWLGDDKDKVGIVQRYMMLGDTSPVMGDINCNKSTVQVKNRMAQCFTICESERLPNSLASVSRVTELSSVANSIYLSMGSKLGVLLDCEHAVNQIIVVPAQDVVLKEIEEENNRMKNGKNSRDNVVNSAAIDEFLMSVEANSDYTVKCHTDVIAWSAPEQAMRLNSRVSTAISGLLNNTKGVFNSFNTPVVWYGTIPGCAIDLGKDNEMTLPLLPSLLLGTYETFFTGYPGGLVPFRDRMRNVPVPLDFHKVAHDKYHLIDDYNMFICGPTGSGKSYFTNYYARCCYDNGESVFIIDVGDSYEILCNIIREESGGVDGQYLSWDIEHPFSFNPLVGYKTWVNDRGNLNMDNQGVNFFLSILQTLWKPKTADGWTPALTRILRQMVQDFVAYLTNPKTKISGMPVFDDFYNFIVKKILPQIENNTYKVGGLPMENERLDVKDFALALQEYSLDGGFSFLLNNPSPADFFTSRFVVFEVDAISQVNDDKQKTFYSLCILCMMNAFDNKMRSVSNTGHKNLIIEEAWKAIANETMAPYLQGLWKTSRKFNTSAIVVTQEINDILASEVIKETIMRNSSTKVLLDQKRNLDLVPSIVEMCGLGDKDANLIYSLNRHLIGENYYKEAFISFMGTSFVVAHEVSTIEAVSYESEKEKKRPLIELAREIGYKEAVIEFANRIKKEKEYATA